MDVNGTLFWYYNICKREVWLMTHQIVPDQQNDNISFGRFLHETTYQRNKKEILFGNVKFDVILEKGDHLVIGETKKSSRYSEASKWQLMYYLQVLKSAGIHASGELLYPQEKKRESVELTQENEIRLEQMRQDIIRIAEKETPLEPLQCKYCKKCGYEEYCWA